MARPAPTCRFYLLTPPEAALSVQAKKRLEVLRLMTRAGLNPIGAKVLVLGLAFKEDCPDLRNTRVIDIVRGLEEYGIEVFVHDPWAEPREALGQYGVARRLLGQSLDGHDGE